jgi:hypothetical protein
MNLKLFSKKRRQYARDREGCDLLRGTPAGLYHPVGEGEAYQAS